MGCCSGDADDDRRLDLKDIKPRRCTDALFAVIFGIFVIGMAVVCGWGVDNGEPQRLVHGHDSYGNICGESNHKRIEDPNSGLDMSNYKHSYYTLDEDVGFRQLCVAACPGSFTNNQANIQALGLCLGVGPSPYVTNNNPNASSAATQACPSFAYSSFITGVTDRCFPQANNTLTKLSTSEFNGAAEVEQAMADIYAAADIIGWMCLLSIIGVFTFIALMRWCAGPIVWTAIFVCFVFLCCAFGAFAFASVQAKHDLDGKPKEEQTKAEQANFGLVVFGVAFFGIVLLIYTCVVIAMRKRIAQAVDIFEEAAVALFTMPTTFCCPFITAFFVILWMAACIAIILYVATANEFTTKTPDGYISYVYTEDQRFLLWYMIFAVFWGTQLLLAMLEFTVASNAAIWYLNEEKPPGWPLKTSIFRIFRYHFGSLAFGSMIVAIIQLIRVILEFVEHQAKKTEMGDTAACLRKWIFNCIRCLLYCLEKCVKFINKNAYIQIAIWGTSFCTSCWNVFGLLRKHIALISVVNGVAYLIVFIIKLGVCVGAAFLTYLWVRTKEEIEFYALVVCIVFLLSLVLVDAFTDVYEVCAEAIMILVLEDHDKNSPGPFLMSERLGAFHMGDQKVGQTKDGGTHREYRKSSINMNPGGEAYKEHSSV